MYWTGQPRTLRRGALLHPRGRPPALRNKEGRNQDRNGRWKYAIQLDVFCL